MDKPAGSPHFDGVLKRARAAAFLDRDGVLNVDHGYTYRPDDLELIPTAAAAVRLLNDAGYDVIVVSNQSGVARGFFDEAAVERFNEHLQATLSAQGARLDAIYYCPHHPEGKVKALSIACDCRKPKPGLLEQAARERPIDRARSFLIGDKDDDIAAARAFGIRGVKFDAKAGTLEDLVRTTLAPTA
jgi:D-glycero-D-manno-heptose 1,7-bisphosphate phosphatase